MWRYKCYNAACVCALPSIEEGDMKSRYDLIEEKHQTHEMHDSTWKKDLDPKHYKLIKDLKKKHVMCEHCWIQKHKINWKWFSYDGIK